MCSCAYNSYGVSREKYTQSEYVTNAKQVAVQTLKQEGYEIKRANWQVIETKVYTRRVHITGNDYSVEFNTWIKVFLEANRVKSYCSQKVYSDKHGDSELQACTDDWVLERLDESVKEVIDSLTTGL